MSERLPTADQLVDDITEALKRGDLQSVDDALRVLAVVDPRRCVEVITVLRFGLEVRRAMGEAS